MVREARGCCYEVMTGELCDVGKLAVNNYRQEIIAKVYCFRRSVKVISGKIPSKNYIYADKKPPNGLTESDCSVRLDANAD
jgi:hypothetical protein